MKRRCNAPKSALITGPVGRAAVPNHFSICRDKNQTLELGLRDKHSLERIFVRQRQLSSGNGVRTVN